jgi:hypothetical protein
MAEAAVAEINRPLAQEFDWNHAESQFRPPEHEIYGRSLSTIRRLGAFMMGKPLAEIPNSPEAAQARVEFYTSVEEGFGTDMELGGGLEVRDFDTRQVVDGKVTSEVSTVPVSKMTEDGLICALETHANDQRFKPQLIRSQHDHANALKVDEMVQEKTDYNTRIIVSPFPEEAAAQSGDDYWRGIGYVPHLKRGFVQLYHVTEDGELLAGSLSFDGSNKQRLREVFIELGIDVPAGEVTDNWLKYAITDNLSTDQAKKFATMIADQLADPELKKSTNTVDVTGKYRKAMDQVFDESYIHLCESLHRKQQTEGLVGLVQQFASKAHHFSQRYAVSLYNMRAKPDIFTDDDAIVLHEMLVYSTVEMMRALHLGTAETIITDSNVDFTMIHLQQIDSAQLQNMLGGFGAEGAKNNRVISACGSAINLGGESSEISNSDGTSLNPQSSFGGQDSGRKEKGEGVGRIGVGLCVVPNCPTSPRKVLVGGCGVCLGRCQKLFDIGKDPTKMLPPLSVLLGNSTLKAKVAAEQAQTKSLTERDDSEQASKIDISKPHGIETAAHTTSSKVGAQAMTAVQAPV